MALSAGVAIGGILLVCLAAGGAAGAEAVFPPGSRIGLVPTSTMKLTRGLSGFQDPTNGTAFLTVEMPADAYPGLAASFTDEALQGQGFTADKRETVKIGDADALLVSGEQVTGTQRVPKSVLLTAQAGMTALVIAQSPAGAPPALEDHVRAILRTVVFRPPLTMEQQLAALPFGIRDPSGFRPVRVMGGSSVLLTDGPMDMVKGADQPVLIVAQSFAPGPTGEMRSQFARQILGSNTLLKDIVLERSQSFRQGGADWHEIVAKGKDANTDEDIVVLQTIRFEPDGFLRMVGVVRADQRDAIMPRFRSAVDSVAPR